MGRSRSVAKQLFLSDAGPDDELIAAARAALVAEQPAFVVPTDDAAVELLQALAASAQRELPESDPLLALLRDSLGDFSKRAVLRQRQGLAHLAAEIGVRAGPWPYQQGRYFRTC